MQKLTFTVVSFDNTQVYSRKSLTPRSSFCQFFRWDGWRLQLVLVRDLKPNRCARAIFLQTSTDLKCARLETIENKGALERNVLNEFKFLTRS